MYLHREAVALMLEADREMAREDASGGAVIREPHHRHGVKRRDFLRYLAQHGCAFLRGMSAAPVAVASVAERVAVIVTVVMAMIVK